MDITTPTCVIKAKIYGTQLPPSCAVDVILEPEPEPVHSQVIPLCKQKQPSEKNTFCKHMGCWELPKMTCGIFLACDFILLFGPNPRSG